MFVCMVGAGTDGHKYIPDAVEKGASVIVVERDEEDVYKRQSLHRLTAGWS